MLTTNDSSDEVDDGEEADEEHPRDLEENGMQGLHAESARVCSRQSAKTPKYISPFKLSSTARFLASLKLLPGERQGSPRFRAQSAKGLTGVWDVGGDGREGEENEEELSEASHRTEDCKSARSAKGRAEIGREKLTGANNSTETVCIMSSNVVGVADGHPSGTGDGSEDDGDVRAEPGDHEDSA